MAGYSSGRSPFDRMITTLCLRKCTYKGWALGCERLTAQTEVLGLRRGESKGSGRPMKPTKRVRLRFRIRDPMSQPVGGHKAIGAGYESRPAQRRF